MYLARAWPNLSLTNRLTTVLQPLFFFGGARPKLPVLALEGVESSHAFLRSSSTPRDDDDTTLTLTHSKLQSNYHDGRYGC